MGSRNMVFVVVLVAVIVAAIVILARRTIGPESRPDWVGATKVQRVDTMSGALITRTNSEWDKLGHDGVGRFKNPDTKEFTMVDPIKCASCGELIAPVQYSPEILAMPQGTPQRDAAEAKAKAAYVCPKCHNPAYAPESRP